MNLEAPLYRIPKQTKPITGWIEWPSLSFTLAVRGWNQRHDPKLVVFRTKKTFFVSAPNTCVFGPIWLATI